MSISEPSLRGCAAAEAILFNTGTMAIETFSPTAEALPFGSFRYNLNLSDPCILKEPSLRATNIIHLNPSYGIGISILFPIKSPLVISNSDTVNLPNSIPKFASPSTTSITKVEYK